MPAVVAIRVEAAVVVMTDRGGGDGDGGGDRDGGCGGCGD